jgi:SAM-dependent methyltransferase
MGERYLDMQFLKQHWDADIYEQQETQTDDVDYIISNIGTERQNILEVCCGGGRILVPLAKAGHTVTGFDMDEFMLEKLTCKAKDIPNLTYKKADAVFDDWGTGFDTVLLAANIMINIVSAMDYKQSQQLFLQKAYDCIRQGGHLYLDYDNNTYHESFDDPAVMVHFDGTDDLGTYGRYMAYDASYDDATQIYKRTLKTEITAKDGTMQSFVRDNMKHFPKLVQVRDWLEQTGFVIERSYGDYNGSPLTDSSNRAIFWAKKQ